MSIKSIADMGACFLIDTAHSRREALEVLARNKFDLGLIYQFHNLIPTLNVVENITLPILMDKRKARTLVTIVGVVLSAALITAVATFAVSLQTYMVNGAIMKYGNWHVAFPDVDTSFVQEQADDSKVANIASFENIGYTTLKGGQNPDKPYLFIAGFNKDAFSALAVELLSDRLPENSSEILVPAHVIGTQNDDNFNEAAVQNRIEELQSE